MVNATEDNQTDLDIWFTQDALDADNFPATQLMAEYAVSMTLHYKIVYLWLDVSTAQRCLSRPRFKHPFQDSQGSFLEEIPNGDINGFMGNGEEHSSCNEVLEDSLLCQQYDAALLLHVVLKVITKSNVVDRIKVNVILGEEGLTKQVIWEPLVPNNFLFFDFENNRINRPERVVDLQETLEEIVNVNVCYEVEKEEPGDKKCFLLKYNSKTDNGRRTRRTRFKQYIQNQIDSSHLFSRDDPYHYVYHQIETAVKDIENRDSILHVIVCAPITNCSKMVHAISDRSRITKVVGQLLTLHREDNLVGAQWNEYLDLEAATSFFKDLDDFTHSCDMFFTPTQCFKKSKNNVFTEQLALKELNNTISRAVNSTNCQPIENDFLGFQRLWNLAKSAQLTRNPDYTKVKGEPIFDPVAVCYLHNETHFKKILKCEVETKNGILAPVIHAGGRFSIPNIRHPDSISLGVLSTVLNVYGLRDRYEANARTSRRYLVGVCMVLVALICLSLCSFFLPTDSYLPNIVAYSGVEL